MAQPHFDILAHGATCPRSLFDQRYNDMNMCTNSVLRLHYLPKWVAICRQIDLAYVYVCAISALNTGEMIKQEHSGWEAKCGVWVYVMYSPLTQTNEPLESRYTSEMQHTLRRCCRQVWIQPCAEQYWVLFSGAQHNHMHGACWCICAAIELDLRFNDYLFRAAYSWPHSEPHPLNA